MASAGMVIRANAIQSNKWDEKRLLNSARPTMPPSPGSELMVSWIFGKERGNGVMR